MTIFSRECRICNGIGFIEIYEDNVYGVYDYCPSCLGTQLETYVSETDKESLDN